MPYHYYMLMDATQFCQKSQKMGVGINNHIEIHSRGISMVYFSEWSFGEVVALTCWSIFFGCFIFFKAFSITIAIFALKYYAIIILVVVVLISVIIRHFCEPCKYNVQMYKVYYNTNNFFQILTHLFIILLTSLEH